MKKPSNPSFNKPSFKKLVQQVLACNACGEFLPLGPRPVIQIHPEAQLLIIGQAPGIRVHQTGVPWDDASGERLREWIGISKEIFYDKKTIAILPIGFCYPGTGERGDLPPRKECFKLWHSKLVSSLPNIKHTLLIGSYAQASYLKNKRKKSLTETVRSWKDYSPQYIPLPHPSPLNNIWLHKNRWFEKDVLPELKSLVKSLRLTEKNDI
jgi:uracil-DNA glycosylase